MNVLPELRDQLTAAVAAPRRARRVPVKPVLAFAAAVCAVALAVSLADLRTEGELVDAGPARSMAPVDELRVGCERGYVLRRKSLGGGDWRRRAVQAGPATFVGLAGLADAPAWRFAPAAEYARHLPRDEAEQLLENGRDRYAAVGLNVLVEPDTKVTIVVDPRARDRVALLSALPRFGGYRAADGAPRMTLTGCPPVPPEARNVKEIDEVAFGVAFIVERARCVPIFVVADGRRTIRRVVSFGAGRCP